MISVKDIADQESSFKYENNDLVKSIDPKGINFDYQYDSKHNILKAVSGQNVVYNFTYDSSGNPLTAKVGYGNIFVESKATYTNSKNYLSSITDSSGNTILNSYDETEGTLKTVTDAKGKVTCYGYDILNRLISVEKVVSGQTITNNYAYENDQLKKITHNGFSYNFEYGPFGNPTRILVGTQELIIN